MNHTKIEYRSHTHLATLTFYVARAVRVTSFSTGRKFRLVSDFYVVTPSYSSRPFLCTLVEYYAGLLLFLRCHTYNHAELVIGTKPPYLFHDAPSTTHITERRKPVSEDHGYGTQELATLPSDDESEGADDELQAVDDIPAGALQVKKKGPQKTVESTQQPAASSSTGPNTPHSTPHSIPHSTSHHSTSHRSTSHYTTVDKSASLTALADKPPFSTNGLAPPNNSTKHRLELLDTGQPPGKYDSADSTLEETWCLESSPSLDRHQGELVIVTTSNALPISPPLCSCILPAMHWFTDKYTMTQEEEGYKVVNPVPFYAMAGP